MAKVVEDPRGGHNGLGTKSVVILLYKRDCFRFADLSWEGTLVVPKIRQAQPVTVCLIFHVAVVFPERGVPSQGGPKYVELAVMMPATSRDRVIICRRW